MSEVARFLPGHRYRVTTRPGAQSPSFTGSYTGPLELAGGLWAHEFLSTDAGGPMAEWYPVLLDEEIEAVRELKQ
jgi:hypothetical protein